MPNAAIYLRLSRETESSTSITRQREACHAFAASRGWDIVLECEDVDVSASKRRLDRPGLTTIREAMERGDIEIVLFWRTDRLARSIIDFSTLMAEADAHGVALVSATEPLDLTSPMGRAMAQIVAIFAEMEARAISDRTKSSHRHLLHVGRATGGKLPHWLDRIPNPDGPGYVETLNPERAAIVREALTRLTAGESANAIAADFRARDVPRTYKNTPWRNSAILRWAHSDALTGQRFSYGQTVRDATGQPVPRPALLTVEEHNALLAALEARTPYTKRQPVKTLLAQMLGCEECGGILVSRGRVYACNYSVRLDPCPGVAITRERLDDHITNIFLERVGGHPVVTYSAPSNTAQARAEYASINAALADLERDRYERGAFTGDEGARRFNELHARLSTRALAVLDQIQAAPTSAPKATGKTYGQEFLEADLAGRRQLLANEITTIWVKKGRSVTKKPPEDRVNVIWRAKKVTK